MIQVSHLSKYYGDFLAVNDLSFDILESPADSVSALSWTNESGTCSFTKAALFTIEDVDDYGQYGRDARFALCDV